MADKVTRVLLEIIALDKATSVLKGMMEGLQGWADKMNGVGAETAMTSDQLEAAQVRLQGASDAYDAALEKQAEALGTLKAAQTSVTEAQVAAAAAQEQAQAAAAAAAGASTEEAAALTEAAAKATAAAATQAGAVKAASDAQVAAYDKLMASEALVEKRTAQVAEAQAAAGVKGEESAVKIGKMGPLMLAAGAGAAYLAYKSVQLAAGFQTSMTKLVTSAGESQSALAMVGAGVLQISDQTGIAATDLAKALYYVDSASYHGAASLTILTAAAKGARDEQADTSSVTNALTTVMTNYGLKANQATMAMNEMIMAVSLGKTNLQEFSVALAQVLPLAAANNISFAQVGAALASMTAKGMSAEQAAQNLAFSIRNLAKPNGVAITMLGQLGLTSTQVQKTLGSGPDGLSNAFDLLSNTVMKHMGPAGTLLLSTFNQSKDAAAKAKLMFDGMSPSLQALASKLENGTIGAHDWALAIRTLDPVNQKMMQQFATMFTNANSFSNLVTSRATPAAYTYATAMSNLMGGAAGLNTALMLVGSHGASAFATNVQKMDAVANQANKDVDGWSVVQGTFNQKLAEGKQTLINTGIAIGTTLLPYVTKLISSIMAILTPLAAWVTAHQKLIGTILAIAGPFLMVIGIFMTLAKIVGLAKAAMAAFRAVMLVIEETDPIILALTAVIAVVILSIKYWKQIKEAVAAAWNWIKAHANEVAVALAVILGPFGAILAAALEIYVHWKEIGALLVRIWNDVATGAERIWNDVASFFTRMWGDVESGTEKAWNNVSGFLKRTWNDVAGFSQRIWNDVSGFFKRIWNDVAGYVGQQMAKISAPILKEWQRIESDLKQIWSELVTLWDDTGGKLVTMIAQVWSKIVNGTLVAWQGFTIAIKAAWDFVSGVVSTAAGYISGIIKAAWDFVVSQAKSAWSAFWFVVKHVWDLLVISIKAQLEIIGSLLRTAWNAIKGAAQLAWDLISGVIQSAWDFVTGIVRAALDLLMGILRGAWDAIQATAEVAWDFLTGVINTALDFIKNILAAFIDVVTGKWGKAWTDLKTTFLNLWNNLKSTFSSILNDIKNAVIGAARDIGTGFINGIEDAVNGATRAVQGIWNSIVNFFAGAINWLVSTGENLIQGLVNGIEGWASHLWDSLSNLASGILGKIGNFLGLGSPSRITHQHGVWLVEGLVNGINASAGKAASAARSLALGVLAGTRGTLGQVTLASAGVGSGALFAGSASASSRPVVYVNNDFRGANIAGPQSIRWITDQIDKNFVQKVVPTAGITTRRTGG